MGGPAVAAVAAGDNGGTTDVGVTGDSILLGNVADLSGPVPGLFRGAVDGTLAYLNYINSQGGVNGRQLKMTSADSQTQCNQAQIAFSQLAPKVFAFVGSFVLYDDCAAQVLAQHHDVPDLQVAITAAANALPNVFSISPLRPGAFLNGQFLYYAAKFGDAVKHAATLYSNIGSAAAAAAAEQNAARSAGWTYVYKRAFGATETNFTADIVRMRQQGVQVFESIGMPPSYTADFIQQANQQNWHPIIIDPQGYAANFLQLMGSASAAEGLLGFQSVPLFFGQQDAAAIPEVALFQQWVRRTDPNLPMDIFAVDGWAEAKLFVQALRAAGPKPTRKGVLAALSTIHEFDGSGLVAPADPAGKGPPHCYILWQLHSGQYQRVDTPATGFRCDGTVAGG
ncbi:MAG: ABC transporter substrate-binding protein [Acidimicrobiales bacterium]